MKIQISASANAINYKDVVIRGGDVLLGANRVGYINYDVVKNCTPAQLAHYYDDKKLLSYIRKLTLPKTFTYVWIEDLNIDSKFRHRGIGTAVIQKIAPNNTVIACNVGSGNISGGRMNQADRIKFYKSMGFKILTDVAGYTFAILVVGMNTVD